MKISDGYRKLDKRLIIALKQNEGVFEIASTLEGRTPTHIFEDKGDHYIQMFFDKNRIPHGSLAAILARNDMTDKSTYYTLAEKLTNSSGMKTIQKIMNTSSVTMNDSYLLKDELFVDFRFHRTKAEEINEILAEYDGKVEGLRLESMKESESLKDRMMHIHQETPLTLVRYSVGLPLNIDIMKYLEENSGEVIAEVENRHLLKGKARIILYSAKPLDFKGISPISIEENIFETYVDQSGILGSEEIGNLLRIPRLAFFLTKEHGKLVDTTFVQSTGAGEYVSLIMSLKSKNSELKPVVEHYAQLDDEVWEWL